MWEFCSASDITSYLWPITAIDNVEIAGHTTCSKGFVT